jgi:hypothetical protein
MRRVFGPEKEEVIGKWEKIANEIHLIVLGSLNETG